MDALPNELLEKILVTLTYKDQGRFLTVSRLSNKVIKKLLPAIRFATISSKKGCFGEYSFAVLDRYTLISRYEGNPVYFYIYNIYST